MFYQNYEGGDAAMHIYVLKFCFYCNFHVASFNFFVACFSFLLFDFCFACYMFYFDDKK